MNSGIRSLIAAALSGALAFAQQSVFAPIAPVRPQSPIFVRPYEPVTVPPIRTENSPRLSQLIRAGALYLTAQDAVALALENNIDIEIARYGPVSAEWRLQRAQAGGALPGVPSASSQTGAVASGQGVAGSQNAAGVRITGVGNQNPNAGNATISQIGPVTQNLDPIYQQTSNFSHTSNPQPNSVQSVVQNLVSDTRVNQGMYQQGLLSGGLVRGQLTNNYLFENSPTNILNPSTAQNLSFSAQHNLLRGFGVAVNARTITVARMNIGGSDLMFRSQVTSIVAQVLNAYYNLAASEEDLRAKQNAAIVAQEFLKNVQRQIDLGALAPIESVSAENLAISAANDVTGSEATAKQTENQLKNLLSRNGLQEPALAAARIIPVDRISIPATDDLPPLEDLVKSALANRPDLKVQQINVEGAQVNALGTRNALLPALQVFGSMNNAGLAGEGRPVTRLGPDGQVLGFSAPDPYFVGGAGSALGQVFRRNFPTQRAGAFFNMTLRNRAAQADAAIDQLSIRQSELSTAKSRNQVQVDVMNDVVAIQQARARYEAAVQNRRLQEQLFAAEQKKFQLGASVPYNVIQTQRDLISAQAAEIQSLASYSNARIALDQALGRTLEANNVTIEEARSGAVGRTSAITQ